jgi:hypothetical protein
MPRRARSHIVIRDWWPSSPRRVPALATAKPDVWSCAEDGTVFLWDAVALEVAILCVCCCCWSLHDQLLFDSARLAAESDVYRSAMYAKRRGQSAGK